MNWKKFLIEKQMKYRQKTLKKMIYKHKLGSQGLKDWNKKVKKKLYKRGMVQYEVAGFQNAYKNLSRRFSNEFNRHYIKTGKRINRFSPALGMQLGLTAISKAKKRELQFLNLENSLASGIAASKIAMRKDSLRALSRKIGKYKRKYKL